ncbi:MAG: DUF502 domain-containing protein [Planctomycetes bacterium]|nr:DUF502 domain-containing protein [Planctomycetota bacterium]
MKVFVQAFKKNFVAGILVLIPAGLTAWMIVTLWNWVNQPLYRIFDKYGWEKIPGVGLIVVVAGIYLVGMLARSILGGWLISFGEAIVNRLPFVGKLYSGIKQIVETILSSDSNAFRKSVLIEYPRKGLWTVAFMTGQVSEVMEKEIDVIEGDTKPERKVYCFVPTTPNPTSGYLVMVPECEIVPLDISVDDAIKLIISGGIVSPYRQDAVGGKDNNVAGK